MKPINQHRLVATALLVGFLAVMPLQLGAQPLEPLHAISLTETDLIVEVTSNGCTEKGDFILTIKDDRNLPEVSIQRIQQDMCEAMPYPERFVFSLRSEVGVRVFKLENPLVPGIIF